MNAPGGDALAQSVRLLALALLTLAIVLLIALSALLAFLVALTAILLLLAAYTIAGLAAYVREVSAPPTEHPLPDEMLDRTPLGPHRAAFRAAGRAIAQAICLLTSLAGIWLIVGWIGATGVVTLARLVYGLSCLLPLLLLLATRGPQFGALFLGGLAALALTSALVYAPPIIVPFLFAILQAVAALTAYHHLSHLSSTRSPLEVSDGQQATVR